MYKYYEVDQDFMIYSESDMLGYVFRKLDTIAIPAEPAIDGMHQIYRLTETNRWLYVSGVDPVKLNQVLACLTEQNFIRIPEVS